jgi:hypothetical protein
MSDPKLTHTKADPGAVTTEVAVPNEAKAVPTDKGKSLLLSIIASAIAVLAIIVGFALNVDWLGFTLGLSAAITALVALLLTMGDQRTGSATAGLVLVACGVVAIITLLDLLGAEDADPLDGVRPVDREVEVDVND